MRSCFLRAKASAICSRCWAAKRPGGWPALRFSCRTRVSPLKPSARGSSVRSSRGQEMRKRSRRWLHTSAAQATTERMNSPSPQDSPAAAGRPARLRVVAVGLVVLAVIAAGLWLDTRGRIGATQEELAKRLRDIEVETRDAHTLGKQNQDALREALAKLAALEARIADSQNQQLALEA